MLLKLVSFFVASLFLIKFFQFLSKNQFNSKKTNIRSKKKNINIEDFKDAEFEEIDDK